MDPLEFFAGTETAATTASAPSAAEGAPARNLPAQGFGPHQPAPRGRFALAIGLLVIYAAFWVGPFGVLDLYEYAENAEHLWLDLRWDMHRNDSGPRTYSRFSIGLPLISGPFVYAGQMLEWASDGVIGRRWVMATMQPLAMAGACLLLEHIALLIGFGLKAARWSAIILGVSAAGLFYTRFYFVEPVLGLFALASVYAFLRADDPGTRRTWLWWCGSCAGAALLCHYAYLFLIAGLGLAYAVAVVRTSPLERRFGDLMALAGGPVIAGLMIMGMNWHNFGNPLRTGYSDYEPISQVLGHIKWGRNCSALATTLLGTPWVIMAMIALWRSRATHTRWAIIATAILAALMLQQAFWMAFKYYYYSPLRYDVALVMIAAIGLPACAIHLMRRWPRRGLTYASLVLVTLAVGAFLGGNNDFHPPFVNDPDDLLFPGHYTTATWYADRGPYQVRNDYLVSADGTDITFVYPLTPVGARQLIILALLLCAGSALIAKSWAATRTGPGGGSSRATLPGTAS